jgi:hypothetical protein
MGLEYNQVKTLEYAALLHDFGKVSINPEVQYKKKNLHSHDKERINLTLVYLYCYQYFCNSRKHQGSRSYGGKEIDLQ